MKQAKKPWWKSYAVGVGFFVAMWVICSFLCSCAPLQWAVTQDPLSGVVPALSALPESVDDGISGLLQGGIFGVLAFIGTYGKTLRRMYLGRSKKK